METKEELKGKVILDVEPISCSMRMNCSLDPDYPVTNYLAMHLRIVDGEVRTTDRYELADKHELTDVLWTIEFLDRGSGNEFTKQHNAVGMLSHYKEFESKLDEDYYPEACHGWVILDLPTFNLLRDMALEGKLASGMRLHVLGMEYGWEPDGDGKVWDVEAHRSVAITRIEVIANLVRPPEPKEDEVVLDPFWKEAPPPSPELAAMHEVAKAIERVRARLAWVVVLLALTAVVVIFR